MNFKDMQQNGIPEEILKKIADLVDVYHNNLRVASEDLKKKLWKAFKTYKR